MHFDGSRDIRMVPAGTVVTVLQDDHAVLWLCGEIDLSMEQDLASVVFNAGRLGSHVVIDSSHVTFCDATLLKFLSSLTRDLPVTIRHPTPLVLELLAISDMISTVKIDASI
jgi:hypothetical protein